VGLHVYWSSRTPIRKLEFARRELPRFRTCSEQFISRALNKRLRGAPGSRVNLRESCNSHAIRRSLPSKRRRKAGLSMVAPRAARRSAYAARPPSWRCETVPLGPIGLRSAPDVSMPQVHRDYSRSDRKQAGQRRDPPPRTFASRISAV